MYVYIYIQMIPTLKYNLIWAHITQQAPQIVSRHYFNRPQKKRDWKDLWIIWW